MVKNNSQITTIKLSKETKNRLDRLKEHHRETYDEVLRKLLFILNTLRKSSEKSQRILMKIDRNVKSKGEYTGGYSGEGR